MLKNITRNSQISKLKLVELPGLTTLDVTDIDSPSCPKRHQIRLPIILIATKFII